MDGGEGDVGTAREPALAVPADHLSSLGPGREAPGPALVHGVPDVVVDRHHHGGVTGDALDRLDVDQAMVLELARQLALVAGLVDQVARGTWATTKNGLAVFRGSRRPRHRADEIAEGVAEALVPRLWPSGRSRF